MAQTGAGEFLTEQLVRPTGVYHMTQTGAGEFLTEQLVRVS